MFRPMIKIVVLFASVMALYAQQNPCSGTGFNSWPPQPATIGTTVSPQTSSTFWGCSDLYQVSMFEVGVSKSTKLTATNQSTTQVVQVFYRYYSPTGANIAVQQTSNTVLGQFVSNGLAHQLNPGETWEVNLIGIQDDRGNIIPGYGSLSVELGVDGTMSFTDTSALVLASQNNGFVHPQVIYGDQAADLPVQRDCEIVAGQTNTFQVTVDTARVLRPAQGGMSPELPGIFSRSALSGPQFAVKNLGSIPDIVRPMLVDSAGKPYCYGFDQVMNPGSTNFPMLVRGLFPGSCFSYQTDLQLNVTFSPSLVDGYEEAVLPSITQMERQ